MGVTPQGAPQKGGGEANALLASP